MQKWDLAVASAFLRGMSDDAFDAEQIRAIQAVYLLDNLARLYGEGYSTDHDMVALYQDLLKGLAIRRREAALV
jgi:hypothetical protein